MEWKLIVIPVKVVGVIAVPLNIGCSVRVVIVGGSDRFRVMQVDEVSDIKTP